MEPYDQNAIHFFNQYQEMDFEDVHQSWLAHLPNHASSALDVGAGSGRDASALAKRGWDVVAVEPATGLRKLGEEASEGLSVTWVNDRLPAINNIYALGKQFGLILISAVWMHLDFNEREQAFETLSDLLAPSGILVITLRHGPGDGKRTFYKINRQELEELGRSRALTQLPASDRDGTDRMGRHEIWWETLIFQQHQ